MPRQLICQNLVDLIILHADKLLFPEVFVVDDTLEPVDKQIFLAAFSLNESCGGYNKTPKFESAYAPGGKYYKKSELQRSLYAKFGEESCKSYSSFQIMLLVFHELGFADADPDSANEDLFSINAAIKYFNTRIFSKRHLGEPNFLGMAGDAYNSGNYRDNIVPLDYIKKLVKNYHLAYDSNLFVPTTSEKELLNW